MKITKSGLSALCSLALLPGLLACGDETAEKIDRAFVGLINNEVVASDSQGLNLSLQPSRSESAADWLPANYGYESTPLTDWQLNKLEFDVMMPQSQKAIESFLGIPFAKEGEWHYWQLRSSNGAIAPTELAIRYANKTAVEYSYVQY